MVWYGMVWYGFVWAGIVWAGIVSMVLYGMVPPSHTVVAVKAHSRRRVLDEGPGLQLEGGLLFEVLLAGRRSVSWIRVTWLFGGKVTDY